MKAINRLAKYATNKADSEHKFGNSSRRAISLIPETTLNGISTLEISDLSHFRQLLLSIEANELSYCIKVLSDKEKSRSVALIFRGRVVGCMYGNKSLKNQIFGKDAYRLMIAASANPGTKITADHINEEFAISVASLFAGNTLEINPNKSTQENFEIAYEMLIQSGSPGCIVINNEDESLRAIVYLFNGKTIGIFLYGENGGWVSNSYDKAWQLISKTPRVKMSATALAAKNVDELFGMSWAMSALNDREADNYRHISQFELSYALVTNYDHERLQRMVSHTSLNPFLEGCRNRHVYS